MREIDQPMVNRLLTSYPPAPIVIGIAGVALGDINAVKDPAVIKISSPVGSAPIDLATNKAIGAKIFITP